MAVKIDDLGEAKPDSDFWNQSYTINLAAGKNKPAEKPAEEEPTKKEGE